MNEPTIRLETRPEVSAFVDRVRERLADLTDEEREELVGGLEADIDELVADGGSVAELGDPRAYADELRSAAGLGPSRPGGGRRPRLRRRGGPAPVAEELGRTLDAVRDRWLALMDAPGLREAWGVVASLRPVWWVARAWVALELFDYFLGNGRWGLDLFPTVGPQVVAALLLLAAVVVSVQIGRRRVWPGTARGAAAWSRLLLAGLNVFAALALVFAVPQLPTQEDVSDAFDHGYGAGMRDDDHDGLTHRGDLVANVFPYDAAGRPLTGVQLFDQDGRPLSVARSIGESRRGNRLEVVYPWLSGEQREYHVFPLPTREQTGADSSLVDPAAWTSTNPPALPTPPLLAVPAVTLPTAAGADVDSGDAGAVEPGGQGRDSENAEDR